MSSPLPLAPDGLPWITVDQMVEVDRAMIEDFRIGLIQMMENAGRGLALLASRLFLESEPRGRSVVILAGSGGNGGGAMVAARRLAGWGARVAVHLTRDPSKLEGAPAHQVKTLQRLGIWTIAAEPDSERSCDLVLDGVIGYGLRGAPGGGGAALIDWANSGSSPVLSLDTPSGLDAATGEPLQPAIRADATLTLALPKRVLRTSAAHPYVGELFLADIGVPPELYARPHLGLDVGPIFAAGDLLRLSFGAAG